MVRLLRGILVSNNRIINPLVICKKIIERTIPEMGTPCSMGKIFVLVAFIDI